MVKKFFVFISIITVIGAAYFTYDYWVKNSTLSTWSFIPTNAVFIYENDKIGDAFFGINEKPIVKNLNLKEPYTTLTSLDSILGVDNSFINSFNDTDVLLSFHIISKDELGLLAVASLSDISQQSNVRKIQDAFIQNGYSKRERRYLDYSLNELVNQDGKVFTFFIYKNYLIASFSGFLVEDAIRTISDENQLSFKEKFPELYSLTKLQNDKGNVYLNLEKFSELLSVFVSNKVSIDPGNSAFLDLEIKDNLIELNGFAYSNGDKYLDNFSSIVGAEFDIAEIISNETSYYIHFSFSNPGEWKNSLKKTIDPTNIRQKEQYISEFDFDPDYLFELLDEEVLAGFYGQSLTPYMVMESSDSEELYNFLLKSSERKVSTESDSLFIEEYRDYKILQLPYSKLPQTFLGNIAGNYTDCFFTTYRNFGIIAEELPVLKEILNDIENENTWSKSIRKLNFLNQANQEAVFSIFIDVPNIWNSFLELSNTGWEPLLKEKEYEFKNLENVAIQLNPVDNNFYLNVLVEQNKNIRKDLSSPLVQNSVVFGSPIITKPYLVKNHNNNLFEVILQDSSNNVYLIDKDFKILWNIDISEPITSQIEQVDFYKNNKLQYLFTTSNKVHIIDRNGEYVEGFPVKLDKIDQIDKFTLIDYNQTRNYRYSFVDKKGNVLLTDKYGQGLEGWNTNNLGSALSSKFEHYRIGGTDVFIAALENGEIHMYSRRGRQYPGFPIKLREPTISTFHLKEGSNFESSVISIITQSGQLISFNLKGATLSRLQLLKKSPDTEFKILRDVTSKDFLIYQGSEDEFTISDKNANTLFSKDYLDEKIPFIQYYRISSNNQYLITGERKGEFIFIYDLNGRLISQRPIAGNNPLSMLYQEEKSNFQLYITNKNELNLIDLPR